LIARLRVRVRGLAQAVTGTPLVAAAGAGSLQQRISSLESKLADAEQQQRQQPPPPPPPPAAAAAEAATPPPPPAAAILRGGGPRGGGGGGGDGAGSSSDSVTPIVVIACNRVTVERALKKLIQSRPSADRFPIFVSQDCGDKKTADKIREFAPKDMGGVQLVQQPDLSDPKLDSAADRRWIGYYKIARHFHFAFDMIFKRSVNHACIALTAFATFAQLLLRVGLASKSITVSSLLPLTRSLLVVP
jgi:hypothetical protein